MTRDVRSRAGGWIRGARRPVGWEAPGPQPRGFDGRPELEPGPHEDLCYLAGDWRILQRTDGHRWSLDDLVTAWVATRGGAMPENALDLGCGVGSVLLLCAWAQTSTMFVGIEAQEVSAGLLKRTVRFNGVEDRVRVVNQDFREVEGLDRRFEQITGTPPYFADGSATLSAAIQKGPCRHEQRGGIGAYADVAAALLAPSGRFVVCHAARQRARVAAAIEAAGLNIFGQLDVVPRTGKQPLVVVFEAAAGAHAFAKWSESLTVRDESGEWTEEFRSVRAAFGMPTRPPNQGFSPR